MKNLMDIISPDRENYVEIDPEMNKKTSSLSEMSVEPPTMDDLPVNPEPVSVPEKTEYEKLMDQFNSSKRSYDKEIADARKKADRGEGLELMLRGLSQLGAAQSGMNVGAPIADRSYMLQGLGKAFDNTDRIESDRINQLKTYQNLLKELGKQKTPALTKGQEALDKDFAKEYSRYSAQGGSASIDKNLNQLKEVMGRLSEDDDITGTLREKLIPFEGVSNYVRSIVNEDAQNIKDKVEQVIQQSLRQTLGAQFTEKEAQRLIERSYNPRLSDEKNMERLQETIDELQTIVGSKDAAGKYFEKHGTLSGFSSQDVPDTQSAPITFKRRTKDGRTAIFDENKKFIRFED